MRDEGFGNKGIEFIQRILNHRTIAIAIRLHKGVVDLITLKPLNPQPQNHLTRSGTP